MPYDQSRETTGRTEARSALDSDESLSHLVALGHLGDQDAVEKVFVQLGAIVRRWLSRHLRGRCPELRFWSEDIASEAMARAVAGLRRCRAQTDGAVVAWVLTLTRHVLADYTRVRSYRVHASTWHRGVSATDVEDTDADGCHLCPPREEPHAELLLVRALMDAYAALPEAAVELLWRRLVMTEDWVEIGRAFATTAGGARRRFDRACRRLRRQVLSHVANLPAEQREAILRELDTRRVANGG